MRTLEDDFSVAYAALNEELVITSPVFAQGGYIPAKYTCDAENVNPPLGISGMPNGTRTFAVILEDMDSPIRPWVHWTAWNIPPVDQLEENTLLCVSGANDFRPCRYFGPCPSSGIHQYIFRVYALDTPLNLPPYITGKRELEHAMSGHILAQGALMFKYKRSKSI